MQIIERKPRVLVVEDHAFLRRLMSAALSETCEVYAAATVKKGWQLYLHHAPDIVFLDIQLPDGNGHELARRIKERQPYAYVVMATSSSEADDIEEAKNNLADGFMIKPFHKTAIHSHIRNATISENGNSFNN